MKNHAFLMAAAIAAGGATPATAAPGLGGKVYGEYEAMRHGGDEIEAGYLFTLSKSRVEADGQLRLVLEYVFQF